MKENADSQQKNKMNILDMSKEWLSVRKKFYTSKNPWYGVVLLKYIKCYDRVQQYFGDWYLIYGKEN